MTFDYILQAILLGVGLAMDASAISAANGLEEPKMKTKKIILISLSFCLFQFFMPLAGYVIGSIFKNLSFIKYFVPIFALLALGYLGIKMIVEALHTAKENKAKQNKANCEQVQKEEPSEVHPTSITFKVVMLQSIATSLDALSVGFVYVRYDLVSVLVAFGLVGIVTFGLCILFTYIGKKFGTLLAHRASLVGGLILVGIGLKIFIEFLIEKLA